MYTFGLFEIPWWILWPFFVVLSLILYSKYKQSYFSRRGIPGPKPSLFMGNLSHIGKVGHENFDRRCADKYGPYFGSFYGNHPVLVICDPDMIKEITVSQFSKFYDRADTVRMPKKWQDSINNAKGTKWKYLRSVIQPTFSPAKVKNMRPILKRCLDDFIETMDNKLDAIDDGVIDIYKMYTALTMDIICSSAFGIEVNSQKNADDQFVRNASKVLSAGINNIVVFLNFLFPDRFFREIVMFISGDWVNKSAMKFLTSTVKQAIQVRKEAESTEFHDLLKQMMDTQKNTTEHGISDDKSFEQMKNEGMSDEDIIINGIIFLAAGFETTSSLLSLLTHSLAAYPDFQDRLVDEIDETVGRNDDAISYDKIQEMEFLDMFVQETLRMYPPAGRFNRQPCQDIEIKGLKLRKGEDITFSTHALHKNPLYWMDPDKFDPDRFSPKNKNNIVPYSYIPFGAGPRNCVGMKLALAEVKMTVVRLLQHVRVMRSREFRTPPEISTKGGILRPKNGLYVKLVKR